MIRGLIFDIDGTLLDSGAIWLEAGTRYLKKQGKEAEPDLGKILWPLSLPEGAAYLKQNYALQETEPEIVEGVLKAVEDFYQNEVQLKEGAAELLAFLKKRELPMVLATTGDRKLAGAALTRLGILPFFQDLLTASEWNTTKREPFLFLKAAERMGRKPEELCVVEDSLHALLSAKKAGCRTAAIFDRSGEADWNRMQEEADFSAETLSELQDLFVSEEKELFPVF